MCIKKVWWLMYPIAACLFAYTNIDWEAFTILGLFLLFDTVTGVVKALAVNKKPTSRMFLIGITSKMLMRTLPLMMSLLVKVTLPSWNIEETMRIVLGLFCCGEFYSIVQNIVSIKLGKEIAEYDAMTKILNWLLRFMRNLIDKNLPKY